MKKDQDRDTTHPSVKPEYWRSFSKVKHTKVTTLCKSNQIQ